MSRTSDDQSVIVSRVSEVRRASYPPSKVEITPGRKVEASRRKKVAVASMNLRTGNTGSFGGGFMHGQGTNIYSPHLSPDFLELPQNRTEQRSYYRHFYNNDPFVGQAIDLHTELPLSKIRLTLPKGQDPKQNRKILTYFTDMVDRINLLQVLIDATREYYVIGDAFIFAEDTPVEVPEEIYFKYEHEITLDGEAIVKKVNRSNWRELEEEYKRKHYEGWSKLVVLPPDQVQLSAFQFSDEDIIELIPDAKTANLVQRAMQGDPHASKQYLNIPKEIRDYLETGQNIPLGTDPHEGSFVYHLARSKPSYQTNGVSILQRCLLPGTPVAVKRDDVIQMMDVEDVDPSTDLILTHKGNFKSFKKGSRPVNENVVVIEVEGQKDDLQLTKDHEVFRVLPNGEEELVEAGSLKEGDIVREVSVSTPPENVLKEIDLVSWWKDRELKVSRVRHDDLRDLSVEKVVKTANGLEVGFSYDQDDQNRVSSIQDRASFFHWLQGLRSPVERSYGELASLLGISKSKVAYYAALLRDDLGYDLKRNPDTRKTIWVPLSASLEIPGSVERRSFTSSITSIPLCEDFLYVMGTWLGDGCAWSSDGAFLDHDRLTWTFGNNDEGQNQLQQVRQRLETLFPDAHLSEEPIYSSNENLALHIIDPLLARFVVEEFGKGCEGKRLPSWIFDLSDSNVLSLLGGLIDTDGHVRDYNGSPQWNIVLKNETLIDQMHLLCNRLGITTSVKRKHRKASKLTTTYQTKEGPVTKTYDRPERDYWGLSCTRTKDAYKCLENTLVKQKRVSHTKPSDECLDSQEVVTRRVLSLSEKAYKGLVYSFGVAGDESHSAGFLAVHNCLRTLVYRDKLRQAQTSIASRAMTPKRLIYAEDLDVHDVEELRDQVDLALLDPDFSIITNYQVNWEEISADSRLLNLSGEYDMTDRQLFAGLGVTESMLTGDGSFGAEKINLEIINNRYLLYRDHIQRYVEEYLFKPIARKKGFVEMDEFGNEVLLYPKLSFTRLAVRDNRDTFDSLFNLYQKGSLSVNYILELFNLDPDAVREQLENDMFTVNDATFNEAVRGVLSEVGRGMVEKSDFLPLFIKYLSQVSQFDIQYVEPEEGGGRF